MFDASEGLFEALLDLFQAWESELEQVRMRTANLLSDSRSGERASAIADRQRRTRIIEGSTTASVLNKCVEELAQLLVLIDEDRVMAVHIRTPGVTHSPPLSGDEGPLPF